MNEGMDQTRIVTDVTSFLLVRAILQKIFNVGYHLQSILDLFFVSKFRYTGQGRIQDLIRGGAQIVTGLSCRRCAAALCKRSEPFSVWGLGPTLGPWKLLGISLLNMHYLHFGYLFILFFK